MIIRLVGSIQTVTVKYSPTIQFSSDHYHFWL
jgi:hypothetical protein